MGLPLGKGVPICLMCLGQEKLYCLRLALQGESKGQEVRGQFCYWSFYCVELAYLEANRIKMWGVLGTALLQALKGKLRFENVWCLQITCLGVWRVKNLVQMRQMCYHLILPLTPKIYLRKVKNRVPFKDENSWAAKPRAVWLRVLRGPIWHGVK